MLLIIGSLIDLSSLLLMRSDNYWLARDITYAAFCQDPMTKGIRYRNFMNWNMPWYSAHASLDALLVGREIGLFHLVCYIRDGNRAFETYWTTHRGVEAMDYSYALMDLTVNGRQEPWEDSPPGWPQQCSYTRTSGGPPDWQPVPLWRQALRGWPESNGMGGRLGSEWVAGFNRNRWPT